MMQEAVDGGCLLEFAAYLGDDNLNKLAVSLSQEVEQAQQDQRQGALTHDPELAPICTASRARASIQTLRKQNAASSSASSASVRPMPLEAPAIPPPPSMARPAAPLINSSVVAATLPLAPPTEDPPRVAEPTGNAAEAMAGTPPKPEAPKPARKARGMNSLVALMSTKPSAASMDL